MKDFIYLDIERVRSFVAQLRRGAPDRLEESTSQRGAGGLRAGLTASYEYEKTSAETRSVHHYLYDEFEADIRQEGKLLVVDNSMSTSSWDSLARRDGQLVLAHGRVRIVDWERLVGALDAVPKIAKSVGRFAKQTLEEKRKKGEVTQTEFQRGLREADPLAGHTADIAEIGRIVTELYGGTVRVKVYPFSEDRSRQLVGNSFTQHFQQPQGAFFSAGGGESPSDWWALGLIAGQATPTPTDSPAVADVLDDQMEALVTAVEAMSRIASGIVLPRIAFSPLAIYREI